MKHLYGSVFSGALLLLLAGPSGAQAQSFQAPTPAEAHAALNPSPASFSKPQLDQILAPIALYPDQLLTQVLMAATFPDQLVDAQKWLQDGNNAALKGSDLANALQALPWDPSVKSLVAFPQIVAMMTDHLDWTETLGAAFANQQVETMSRVQFLRERAVRAGRLKSSPQLAVREEYSDIIIEPTDPNLIYVPVYNPAEVYGTWPDRNLPPVYIPPPPRFYDGAVGAGIGFSVGFGVVAPLWGWGHPDWRRHEVVVDRNRYEHITTQTEITRNHIAIEGGGAWRRTGPVAQVPEAQRPHPVQEHVDQPQGTSRPSQVARPPGVGQGAPVVGPHPGGEPPHRGEAQPEPRPGEPHPGEPARPGEPPHPGEPGHQFVQPGASPPAGSRPAEARPGEPPRPQPGPPHPSEVQPGPHPNEVPQPGQPHPSEAKPGPHPGERQLGPHPGEQHPTEPAHPAQSAAPEAHPAPPPHPAAPAPPPEARPAPPPHPAAPTPPPEARPAPPHPAAPTPPPEAHPSPPPEPHPAPQAQPRSGPPPETAHPAAPAAARPAEKKPPPKPGEEHKDEQH